MASKLTRIDKKNTKRVVVCGKMLKVWKRIEIEGKLSGDAKQMLNQIMV
jgi:hypothetical protein